MACSRADTTHRKHRYSVVRWGFVSFVSVRKEGVAASRAGPRTVSSSMTLSDCGKQRFLETGQAYCRAEGPVELPLVAQKA